MLIETTPLGRIAIPPDLPSGFALFYTTLDFDGRLNPDTSSALMDIVRERFGIEATLTTCTQVHGATVTHAKAGTRWRECDSCDALWSDERQSALGIKVADCLPITMLDPSRSVIANVHSGWRGAVQRVTSATLATIQRETAFDPYMAHAYLGPSIRACCFEVGEEVVAEFAASYPELDGYVHRDRARPHIDQAAITIHVLRTAGFADARIHDSGLCTRCDGSIFHSYRRHGKGGGRNLAVVAQ